MLHRHALTSIRCFATATSKPEIKVGIIMKRTPRLVRPPTDYEVAYHRFRQLQSKAEDAPYQPAFFEAEKLQRAKLRQQQEDSTQQQQEENEVFRVEYAQRETSADQQGDCRSTERRLDRTLYLLVRDADRWQFPNYSVGSAMSLREAAERELKESLGYTMETWVVGNAPVLHYKQPESIVFYMKSHLLDGNVKEELKDYAWLTKDEVAKFVSPDYFAAVKDALADL